MSSFDPVLCKIIFIVLNIRYWALDGIARSSECSSLGSYNSRYTLIAGNRKNALKIEKTGLDFGPSLAYRLFDS